MLYGGAMSGAAPLWPASSLPCPAHRWAAGQTGKDTAVEVSAVSPCLLMKQPARCMVPGHRLIEEQEMTMPRLARSIFVSSAAKSNS